MRRLLVVVALLFSIPARAQDPASLPVRIALDERPRLSFDVTNAFTEGFRRRFLGGITGRVRIRAFLLDRERRELAEAERTCEMRFDVWDEIVRVRIQDGAEVQREIVRLVDAAFRRCGEVEIPLGRPEDYQAGPRLLVEVALNPVSEELLERTREFMSNPGGSGSGRSIFSAIARLFRSKASASGEVFLFASPRLSLPEDE
ncbi:MAG: hypothetical protein AAF627_17455 [Myxococcota bacterium]